MEFIAADVEHFHRLVADLDALLVDPRVEDAVDRGRRLRSSSRVGSRLGNGRGPPPSRRTWPLGNGAASRSLRPRPMVERASPVMLDTAARPPRPAARTSLAANKRLPRSSRLEPSASHRRRIASPSIISTLVAGSMASGNPQALSHSVAWPKRPIRFTYRCACPNSKRPPASRTGASTRPSARKGPQVARKVQPSVQCPGPSTPGCRDGQPPSAATGIRPCVALVLQNQ
jgi:hypothetical protein